MKKICKLCSTATKVIILLAIISACSRSPMNDTSSLPEEPVFSLEQEAAREWIDAVTNLDGNRILKYTCLNQRKNVEDISVWLSAFSVVGQLLTEQTVKGDVSDLNFETVNIDSNRAVVRVYGELRIAVSAVAKAHHLDEEWTMIRENDTWRWCGSGTGILPLTQISLQAQNIETAPSTASSSNHEALSESLDISGSDNWGIVLVSYLNGYPKLHSIQADGTNLKQLTFDSHVANKSFDVMPAISPDEDHIAFTRIAFSGEYASDIFILDSMNTQPQLLLKDAMTQSISLFPAWSPDGTKIAFLAGTDFEAEVMVFDLETSQSEKITDKPGRYTPPTWSPDGSLIAFMTQGDNQLNLVIANMNGQIVQNVFISEGGFVDYGSPSWLEWASDNQRIIVALGAIYLLEVSTGQVNQLLSQLEGGVTSIALSPDATQIAFTVATGDERSAIYVMDIAERAPRRLTSESVSGKSPIWAPDGKQIAFVSPIYEGEAPYTTISSVDYYIMDTDGGNLKWLTKCFSSHDQGLPESFNPFVFAFYCTLAWSK